MAANKSFHLTANAVPFFEVLSFNNFFGKFNALIVNVGGK
jgi:hypothetical protein